MHYSKEEKERWLLDWQQSGMSAYAYAKKIGLIPQTFFKWTKMERDSRQRFVEIPVQTEQATKQIRNIVIEKGDVKIHLPTGMCRNEMREVIEGLGLTL